VNTETVFFIANCQWWENLNCNWDFNRDTNTRWFKV